MVNFRMPFNRVNQLTATLDWRKENYDANRLRPGADLYDGHRARLSLAYSRQLNERWQVFAGVFHERRGARDTQNSYTENGVNLGVSYRYGAPFELTSAPWIVGLMGTWGRIKNKRNEPILSLTDAQRGTEYHLQLVQTIPLRKDVDFQAYAGWRGMNSNYGTREFNDRYLGAGVTARF
jgi:hypothetical protein